MPENNQSNQNSDHAKIKELLEQNLQLSKQIYQLAEKINRWIFWQQVWRVIKILIIVVPIILGIIYLPPILQKVFAPYQQVLNFNSAKPSANVIELFNQLKNNTPDR